MYNMCPCVSTTHELEYAYSILLLEVVISFLKEGNRVTGVVGKELQA
jgi:hypothetical protein